MCSSTADTSLRLAPDSGGLVAINSWTLCFSDPHLEQQFKVHQLHVWGCTKLWRLRMNLLAAVVNFSITIYLLSLDATLMQATLTGMVCYMSVAVLHYCLARRQLSIHSSCSWVNQLAEVCYSIICTLSMPTMVLHGACMDTKAFVRKLILGSGVLIGYWCRFLTPTFFPVACVLTLLQFAFQAWYLTQPTCDDLLSSAYGSSTMQRVLQGCTTAARWILHGSTAAPVSTASAQTDYVIMTNPTSTMAPPGSCQQLLYAVQLFTGGTLLYVQYRMERDSRKDFLQGKVQLQDGWPRVPTFVRVVLHAVVLLQLFAFTWTLLLGGLNSNTSKHVL